jgi:hypothetical protein
VRCNEFQEEILCKNTNICEFVLKTRRQLACGVSL